MGENIAQSIIDAIQRDEYDDVIEKYIDEANSFLLDGKDKPNFYDEFIGKTLSDLKTTINGCIKARNNPKKKDDLKKYKEGYFNEIIQNANDIVWKLEQVNPVLEIVVAKHEQVYTVKCMYPDKGFTLENIYGFCTRGNSNKKSENGQEGMYGIGIKSLFCFVDELEIESNIYIKVSSSEEKKLDKVVLKIPEEGRRNNQTTLSFSFVYDENGENKHAGFNTKKLTEFIDKVYSGDVEQNFNRFFLDGSDEEIIFDARSLFFTELRGDNRTKENSIKTIILRKENGEEVMTLQSREDTIDISGIKESDKEDIIIKKVRDIDGIYNYLLFHYKSEQISIALRCNQDKIKEDEEDRLYSTYFIGTYNNEKPLLGRKIGCLINTVAINSSRSGLERENEKEPEILKTIMDKGKKTVRILCSLAPNYKEALDILCQLMLIYGNDAKNYEDELVPQYIFENNLREIEESMERWSFGGQYQYILKDEDGVDNYKRIVTVNQPLNSDNTNISCLYEKYRKYVITNSGNQDILIYHSDAFEMLSNGIKILCKALFEDNNSCLWVKQICQIPFLNDVKSVLIRRIGGYDFTRIQEYLSKFDENEKKFMKQLIARYEVSDCFDYMGNYSNENIRNWIFDDSKNYDLEYKTVVSEYISSYGKLKERIKNKIGTADYYSSNHWNASTDLWHRKYSFISFQDEKVYENDIISIENDIISILKLICDHVLKIGIDDSGRLFVHNQKFNIILRNRNRSTISWSGTFKYCSLDLLDRSMVTFNSFIIARKYIDKYNQEASNRFKIKYVKRCNIDKIKISDLSSIFKWLAIDKNFMDFSKDEKENIINIKNIDFKNQSQSESELIKFVKRFIGDDVYVKTDIISVDNHNRKFIGFITNISNKSGLYVKNSAGEDFGKVGQVKDKEQEEKYLVIYSSFDNEQHILKEVLSKLEYGKDMCSYINNFIKIGNIRTLSSSMYNRFLKRQRLSYEYPFEYYEMNETETVIDKDLSIEDTYVFLSSKMSYDNHCPLCNQIPTLNIKGNDININSLEKRNSMIAMLVAKYNDQDIYVKILCCKSCFEEYKDSLTEAIVEDIEGANYKRLILKNMISTSIRSHDIINEILISPDNWKIICQFNKLQDTIV